MEGEETEKKESQRRDTRYFAVIGKRGSREETLAKRTVVIDAS